MRNAASSAINALAAKFGQVSISPRSTTPPPAPKVAATPVVSKVGVSALQTEVGAVSTAAGRGRAVAMCQPMPQLGAPAASRPQSAAPKAVPTATKAAAVAAHPPSAPQRQFVPPAKGPAKPVAMTVGQKKAPVVQVTPPPQSYASASSASMTPVTAPAVAAAKPLTEKQKKLKKQVVDTLIEDVFAKIDKITGDDIDEIGAYVKAHNKFPEGVYLFDEPKAPGKPAARKMPMRRDILFTKHIKSDLKAQIAALQGPLKNCFQATMTEIARMENPSTSEETQRVIRLGYTTFKLSRLEPACATDIAKSRMVQSILLDECRAAERGCKSFDRMFAAAE